VIFLKVRQEIFFPIPANLQLIKRENTMLTIEQISPMKKVEVRTVSSYSSCWQLEVSRSSEINVGLIKLAMDILPFEEEACLNNI
jgi:hypothetical protein